MSFNQGNNITNADGFLFIRWHCEILLFWVLILPRLGIYGEMGMILEMQLESQARTWDEGVLD